MRTLLTAITAATLLTPQVTVAQAPAADARIEAALAKVSPEKLSEYLKHLTGLRTRHSLSHGHQDWGVDAARQYILDTFQSFSPKLQVSLDCYDVEKQGRIMEPTQLCNVVAILPGRSERRIYVSGHYDTVARQESGQFDWGKWDNTAPGANDDGSGTVLTMETARVLSQSGLDFDATLVFVAFVAEEEGLVGATLHAARAVEEGWRIDAVLNNDIIGNAHGGNGIIDSRTIRVFSEDPMDSPSRQLARYIRRWAAVYVPAHEVRLIAREDRFGRGGDHTAFNRQGFAGVRFSESRENYSRQHSADDVFEGVDFGYLAKNTRIDAGVAAELAMAPAAPDVMGQRGPMLGRGESGYDADMRWNRSPGAVGYRIVWREAWNPDWQFERYVGDVTEAVLPNLSIDDYVFGVAAVGPDGHESMVSAYVRPPRPKAVIQQQGR